MKASSIPKLEKQAALLASRLKNDILRALSIDLTRFFVGTDSTKVLQWLPSVDKLPTLVANRACEIKELATVDQWFHVNSGDNPADTGTRGISAENSWVAGPSFLLGNEWPFNPNLDVVSNTFSKKSLDDTNVNSTHARTSISKRSEPVFVSEMYSSFFTKLQRYVCFMLRSLPNHKHFASRTLT